MTPFGKKLRDYRAKRKITLKMMAHDLGVTSAYFSALEHGHRGCPSSGLVAQVCGYFDLMWDEAEHLKHLAELSHPRVTVDTAGLSAKATEVANTLAKKIHQIDEDTLDWILAEIELRTGPCNGPTH